MFAGENKWRENTHIFFLSFKSFICRANESEPLAAAFLFLNIFYGHDQPVPAVAFFTIIKLFRFAGLFRTFYNFISAHSVLAIGSVYGSTDSAIRTLKFRIGRSTFHGSSSRMHELEQTERATKRKQSKQEPHKSHSIIDTILSLSRPSAPCYCRR